MLTAEQSRSFLEAALETPYGPVFAVALTTAARPSEYLALKWQDINWERGTVSVARTLEKVSGGWRFAETKRARTRVRLRRNPGDYLVHLYGDTAVINLRVTVHEPFTDADIVTEQRATETDVKENGSWLLIAKQWSNLPVNFRKPVAIDANIYKDYVGEYEWCPGIVETVVVKDGRLWSEMTDVLEYLPAGVDTFFLKEGDLATFAVFPRRSGSCDRLHLSPH